jgi:hypothetical protein
MKKCDERHGGGTYDTISFSSMQPALDLVLGKQLGGCVWLGWLRIGVFGTTGSGGLRLSMPADSAGVIYLEVLVRRRLLFAIAAECENGDGRADDSSTAR